MVPPLRVSGGVALLLAITQTAHAQTRQYRFPDRQTYSRARIYAVDNTRYEARDLVLERDHLRFTTPGRRESTQLDLDQIAVLRVAAGTRALRYGALGALAAGTSTALSVWSFKQSGSPVSDPAAFILGFTAAGGAVGAMIGSFSVRWKNLYVRDTVRSGRISLRPVPLRGISVGLRIAF